MAAHMRYKSLYIPLPSSAKQQGPYACTTATARTTGFYFTLEFRIYLELSRVLVLKLAPATNVFNSNFQFCFAEDRKEMYQEL